jgi:16S rRNA (adenine1518-N6/adenine1519-N6)-dimethyltransferase
MKDPLPVLRKRYSQNFLQNNTFAQQIVETLQITNNDVILEIGAGSGVLTRYIYPLAKRSFFVCEIDPRWIAHLRNMYTERITFLEQNILNVSFESLFNQFKTRIKVIGNIPYHITSPILFALTDQSPFISQAVLMVQKEIADRLTAAPRSKEYGILTVLIGSKATIRRIRNVSRKNFFPKPKVDSTVLELIFKHKIEDVSDETLFRQIVRQSFNTRRKMLHNSLKRILNTDILDQITSVPLTARPEELTIADFKKLANEIHHKMVAKS